MQNVSDAESLQGCSDGSIARTSINRDHSREETVPILIRHSSLVSKWLNKLGLPHDVFTETELATLENLIRLDTGYRSQARWVALDSLFTKCIQLAMLPRPYQKDATRRPPCYRRFVWPTNRAVLLNHPNSIRRMLIADMFRQAGETYLENALSLFIVFMLVYNVSSVHEWGIKLLWNQIQNNDLSAAQSLVVSLSRWPKWALSLVLSSPALYAAYRSGAAWLRLSAPPPKNWPIQPSVRCYGREVPWNLVDVPTDHQAQSVETILVQPTVFGRWWRWFLPLPPCVKGGIQLIRMLPAAMSWNGRSTLSNGQFGGRGAGAISTIDRVTLLLRKMALTESGWTQLTAIHALKQVAHGVSLGDLAALKDLALRNEIIQAHVKAKMIALDTLKQIEQLDHTTHWFAQRWAMKIYANYQLWSLGAYELLGWQTLPYTAYKIIKLYFAVHLYTILIDTIIQAIRCPDEPGFDFGSGYAPWASDYTEACFNELVRQFGLLPGEPASLLVDQIPRYHLPPRYKLVLNNKSLNGSTVAAIIAGFKQNGIIVDRLEIRNSGLVSAESFAVLLPQLTNLVELDISNNQIGYYSQTGVAALGDGLHYLTRLTFLDISVNEIGNQGDESLFAIGKGLATLTNLVSLDISQNRFGWGSGSGLEPLRAIGNITNLLTLNVGQCAIGFYATSSTEALAEGLSSLSRLKKLDLSWGQIGKSGVNGTRSLAQSVSRLSSLAWLDLSHNMIGLKGPSGVRSLGYALGKLPALSALNLTYNNFPASGQTDLKALQTSISVLDELATFLVVPQTPPLNSTIIASLNRALTNTHAPPILSLLDSPLEVRTFLASLNKNIEQIDLSFRLNDPDQGVVRALMSGLAHFSQLRTLNLASNNIGLSSSNSTEALALIRELRQLTSVDLSKNMIGNTGSSSSIVFCNALATLSNLRVLDLSKNQFGLFGTDGVVALGNALAHLTGLQKLNLAGNLGNPLGDNGVAGTIAIGRGLQHLSKLEALDMSNNALGYTGSAGVVAIGSGLSNAASLRKLTLDSNWIGEKSDAGTRAIGLALPSLHQLSELSMSGNVLGQTGQNGTLVLADGLKLLQRLNKLDLSQNAIGSMGHDGAQSIFQALPSMTSLSTLDVSGIKNVFWTEAAQNLISFQRRNLQSACRQQLCYGRALNQTALPTRSTGLLLDTFDGKLPCYFPSGATNLLGSSQYGPGDALLPKCEHAEPRQPGDALKQLAGYAVFTGFAFGVSDEISLWLSRLRHQRLCRYGTLSMVALAQGWEFSSFMFSFAMAVITECYESTQDYTSVALIAVTMFGLCRQMMRHPSSTWAQLFFATLISQLGGQFSYRMGRKAARLAEQNVRALPSVGLFKATRPLKEIDRNSYEMEFANLHP